MKHAPHTGPDVEAAGYPHWTRVYAGVAIVTIAVILSLWLFSEAFSS